MPCVFVIHMRLRLANEFACKVVCISVRLEALKDALSQYATNGGLLAGSPTKGSKTRRGADAAVRARVQRAMEHPSSQFGAPASPHMIILALAKWLRRW